MVSCVMWIMDDWPLNDFTFSIARSTRVGAGMDLMNLIIREVSRGLLRELPLLAVSLTFSRTVHSSVR
jgi:hypothetical protein